MELRPAIALLEEVAADLAARLDALPREQRAEARRLLMSAWLLKARPGRGQKALAAIVDTGRRMDAMVAGHSTPKMFVVRAVRWPVHIKYCFERLGQRLDAISAMSDSLTRRTDRMVKHAEEAAGMTGPPPKGPRRVDSGREPLELVWGETEL